RLSTLTTRPPRTHLLSLHDALPICDGFELASSRHTTVERPEINPTMNSTTATTRRTWMNAPIVYVPTTPSSQAINRITASVYSRSEEHTSELQSRVDLVCRLLLEKK